VPNSCFDPSDLIISAYDADAKTVEITLSIHPGQVRIFDYLAARPDLRFPNRDAVVRWSMCWGAHTLLGPLPSSFNLLEAKMDVLQDERFERQRDCCAESVQKLLASGDKETARSSVFLVLTTCCKSLAQLS
jgi:hypothetical protein